MATAFQADTFQNDAFQIVVATNWEKSLSDTVAIADSISKGMGVARSDTMTLADTSGRTARLNLADTVTITGGGH